MGLQMLIPLTGAPGQLLWCWCWEGSASSQHGSLPAEMDPGLSPSLSLNETGPSPWGEHSADLPRLQFPRGQHWPCPVVVCPHEEGLPPPAPARRSPQGISEQPQGRGREGGHCSLGQWSERLVSKISTRIPSLHTCNFPSTQHPGIHHCPFHLHNLSN